MFFLQWLSFSEPDATVTPNWDPLRLITSPISQLDSTSLPDLLAAEADGVRASPVKLLRQAPTLNSRKSAQKFYSSRPLIQAPELGGFQMHHPSPEK